MIDKTSSNVQAQQVLDENNLLCPFCNSALVTAACLVGAHSFFKCRDCFSLFRIDAGIPKEFVYEAEYYGDSDQEKFWFRPVVWLLGTERRRRARFAVRQMPYAKNVLDAGCGNGALLATLHTKIPANLTGIEIDNVAARRAAKHSFINVLISPFGSDGLSADSQDIIFMIHSFEHMPQPQSKMIRAHELLRDHGLLYIAIPNVRSFQYRIFRKHWLHLDPNYHLHFASPEILKRLTSNLGLQMVRVIKFNPVQNIPGFILSSLDLIFRKRNILFDLLRNKRKLLKPSNALLFLLLILLSIILLPFAVIEECFSSAFGQTATTDYVFRKAPSKV